MNPLDRQVRKAIYLSDQALEHGIPKENKLLD
jgi:hypothetical protein